MTASDEEDEEEEELPTLLISRAELVESSYSELLPVPSKHLTRQASGAGAWELLGGCGMC